MVVSGHTVHEAGNEIGDGHGIGGSGGSKNCSSESFHLVFVLFNIIISDFKKLLNKVDPPIEYCNMPSKQGPWIQISDTKTILHPKFSLMGFWGFGVLGFWV